MAIFQTASAFKELVATQWPFILTAVVASAAAWIIQFLAKGDPISKIPLIGADIVDEGKRRMAYMTSAKDMYKTGYYKFKNGMFRVPSPKESAVVVLDPAFLRELKDLPDDQVSFHGAIVDAMHTPYTDIRADRELIPYVVKRDLTPALNRLNPLLAEEVDQSLQEEIPYCKEFTKVALNHHLLRVVAKVSGRIFVGSETCRSEEYLDMSINYTLEVIGATMAISAVPAAERPAKAAALAEVQNLQRRRAQTLAFLKPLIESRRKAAAEDPDWQKPDDMMQWVLDDGQKKYGEQSADELAEIQLGLTFAAIHTTTTVTTNAFYTIAAMPEIVPELRAEITAVLKEHGTFTTAALQKMKKLDSFLREVMREFPLGWSTFTRKVLKPITLSNGQAIPAGVIISVPHYSMMHDPEVIENPNTFDPWRSYRVREAEGLDGVDKASASAANQMVTVGMQSLEFGYGRHACPGRFFAANEIKMIVSRSLLDYDMRLTDGAKERYPNISYYESYTPDASRELMFKRIAV